MGWGESERDEFGAASTDFAGTGGVAQYATEIQAHKLCGIKRTSCFYAIGTEGLVAFVAEWWSAGDLMPVQGYGLSS